MAARQLTSFKETPEGLLIKLSTDPEDQEDIQDIKDKYIEGKLGYFQAWGELNEVNFCNGYCEVRDEFKGLTEAPMITNGIIDEETTEEEFKSTKWWAFLDYQTRSELDELFDEGFVLFQKI